MNGDYKHGWLPFGHNPVTNTYIALEPMADATSGPLETSGAQASWASFSWHQVGSLGAVYPGHDLNWVRLSAHAPGAATNAVYRWRFDDGRTAEGQQVTKLFLRSGMQEGAVGGARCSGRQGDRPRRRRGQCSDQSGLYGGLCASHIEDEGCSPRIAAAGAMIWAFAEEDTLAQLPLDDLREPLRMVVSLESLGGESRRCTPDGTWSAMPGSEQPAIWRYFSLALKPVSSLEDGAAKRWRGGSMR